METPAEPKPLALPRAIHALFESSAATEMERRAALQMVEALVQHGPYPPVRAENV
jgi:hypothetical protein